MANLDERDVRMFGTKQNYGRPGCWHTIEVDLQASDIVSANDVIFTPVVIPRASVLLGMVTQVVTAATATTLTMMPGTAESWVDPLDGAASGAIQLVSAAVDLETKQTVVHSDLGLWPTVGDLDEGKQKHLVFTLSSTAVTVGSLFVVSFLFGRTYY